MEEFDYEGVTYVAVEDHDQDAVLSCKGCAFGTNTKACDESVIARECWVFPQIIWIEKE